MNAQAGDPARPGRIGRQASTSRGELSHIALQLFLERGFERTTVEDVAAAAGIGRRTVFRYFPSKSDLPWGDFDGLLDRMRAFLRDVPPDTPLIEAIGAAVLDFNRVPPEEIPYHRKRMELLLTVPALVARSTLRYESWRRVIAEYTAERLGVAADGLEPQALGWIFLGVSLSAYEQWLRHEDADLLELIAHALAMLDPARRRPGPAPGYSRRPQA